MGNPVTSPKYSEDDVDYLFDVKIETKYAKVVATDRSKTPPVVIRLEVENLDQLDETIEGALEQAKAMAKLLPAPKK